jgi:hypothetical protein
MTYEQALEKLGLNPDIRLRQMFELGKLAAPTMQEPEIVQRVKRYAGQTLRTARNPNITARECIELANWIVTTPPAQPAPTAYAGYHIMTDKVEIFMTEKQAIDWRDQYQPGFARVEKLVSGGVVE